VASRLGALESEVSSAQGAERAIATEIASNQGALGRAEAKLKRAESELRAAAREGVGSES
jgi:predicted  nucleic acid-binding Zn-ribbon protein